MDMDETTVKDGSHSLCLYKCEDVNRFENSAIYLAMPSKLCEVTSLEQVSTLESRIVVPVRLLIFEKISYPYALFPASTLIYFDD